ncbi:hypothetical protein BU24DRAFT_9650 [Aaosphaeria arxii CBS 175.79]|uniref:Uncharacterized protein n=1 Tax=Aaosphaeria arxii CBS 175.79 TaxID=1450172 RepID=A0A6A5Y5K6_9PLEO|nr:uncharacterized protein BU24DRAFT_9650 [Aaosphaeria arxii CBS 175.79]KAF2020842.1 hypothetical protein BU24DRAFT_9650 [Aaosphaeria arxii CBS 175.79]
MEIPLPPIVSSIFLPRPSTSDINVFPPVSSSLRTTRTFGNPEPTPEVPFATDIIPDLSSILSSILSQVQSQLQSIPFPTQGPFQPGISSSVDEVSSTGAPVQTPIFTRPSSLFSGSFSEPSATTRSVPTGEPSLGTSTKSSIPDVSSDFDFSFPSEVIDLSSRSSQTEDRSEFTSSTKTSRTTAISVPTPSVPFESTTGFANTSSTRSATTRPAPGSTSSLSGSTNASTITTSRFFVSPTSSFTTRPTSTSSSSLEVDSLETSSRVPDSASRNSTSTISETTETQSSSSNSTRTSRTPTSTTDISTSSSENGSFSTIASTTTPTQLINSEAAPPPASSSSGVAAGANEPSAPPLSKSQTAGIAIGGTTCLIIAIIAALFLARRYHRNAAANRKSGGSVYPEVAYIYDPPARGDDQTGANSAPMMSGGAAGYGTLPTHSPRYSTGRLPQNPFREPIIPSPEPSPGFNGSGGPAGNIQGQYSDLAVNPFNAAADYPPLSPYGPPAHRFPREPVRASDRYSDPFSDPFEHDLLLNVRSETPDSIVMLAAAPTSSPRSPRSPRYSDRHPPEKNVYGNYLAVAPPTSPAAPHHRGASSLSYSRSNAQSPDSFSYASYAAGRYTPEHLSSSPNHSTNTSFNSSILRTPHAAVSPSPTHKGWDDIKLDQSLIPKPLNLTSGQRPLSQRRQPPLAGNGQTLLSKFGRAMGIDGSYFSKAQNPPAPAVNGPNANPTLHKQQSEEWADPSLIGRPAF